MMWLKSCSRCKGDLIEESDAYGLFVSCVQCGNYVADSEIRALKLAVKTPTSFETIWPTFAFAGQPKKQAIG